MSAALAFDLDNLAPVATNDNDGAGRLTLASEPCERDGETIYNIYDASGALVHVDNATTNRHTDYVRAGGFTLARLKSHAGAGGVTYLHNDHLGSPVAGTDASTGAVLWREVFMPYGASFWNSPANDNQAGFTGHIRDRATGLNYMQRRYYDPASGRFLSVDPVTFMGSGYNPAYFNRYAYIFNNPVNLTDPTGRSPLRDHFRATGNGQLPSNLSTEGALVTGSLKGDLALTAGIVAVFILGPEDVVIGAAIATKVGQAMSGALKGTGAVKIDVGSPPVSVGNTPNAARADLEAAGFPGSPTTRTSEVGTLHKNVPGAEEAMDVRVMNGRQGTSSGDRNGPRITTHRAGTRDPIKIDGSKFRNNESTSQRNAGCHTFLECN